MTDIDRAVLRLLDVILTLTVVQRVALIREFPGEDRPELAGLALPMRHLLAVPDDGDETAHVTAALLEAIRQMTPQARRVYVRTVFHAALPAGFAGPLLDRLAELIAIVDKGMPS